MKNIKSLNDYNHLNYNINHDMIINRNIPLFFAFKLAFSTASGHISMPITLAPAYKIKYDSYQIVNFS